MEHIVENGHIITEIEFLSRIDNDRYLTYIEDNIKKHHQTNNNVVTYGDYLIIREFDNDCCITIHHPDLMSNGMLNITADNQYYFTLDNFTGTLDDFEEKITNGDYSFNPHIEYEVQAKYLNRLNSKCRYMYYCSPYYFVSKDVVIDRFYEQLSKAYLKIVHWLRMFIANRSVELDAPIRPAQLKETIAA